MQTCEVSASTPSSAQLDRLGPLRAEEPEREAEFFRVGQRPATDDDLALHVDDRQLAVRVEGVGIFVLGPVVVRLPGAIDRQTMVVGLGRLDDEAGRIRYGGRSAEAASGTASLRMGSWSGSWALTQLAVIRARAGAAGGRPPRGARWPARSKLHGLR